MNLWQDHQGTWVLDDLPRNDKGNIDVDVYWLDVLSGKRGIHQDFYGNLSQEDCLVENYDWETHDVFSDY